MWFLLTKLAMGNSKVHSIVLNAIRGLNILTILACELATGSLLVKTSNLSVGWFNLFDAAEKALMMIFGVFLLYTEIPKVPRGWINRKWPLFSSSAGFSAFACCLYFMACDVLSYLTKAEVDKKHIGGDFYRMCQAAGLMTLVVATINLLATFILQDKRKGLTARQVRGIRNSYQEEVS